jgi:UDP-N-acetylmuramate dehydrogenase
LTTLRLGAPARRLVEATRDDEIVEAVAAADIPSEPRLVMPAAQTW